MATTPQDLKRLRTLAKLRADRELRKLAGINVHVVATRERIATLQGDLQTCFDATAPMSVGEWRAANAQAGRTARALNVSEAEMQRLMVRHEALRAKAAREFGRAEVLASLARGAIKEALRKAADRQV